MKRFPLAIRAGYFGLGPVLVAGLFAFTLTAMFWSNVHLHEKYPDPVVGSTSWEDINKSKDTYSLLLLVGSGILLAPLISAVCHQVAPLGAESDTGLAVNQLLLFSLIPAGWRLAVACMTPTDSLPPLRDLCWPPLGAIAMLLMLRRYRRDLSASDVLTVGGAALLAPLMAMFSALAVVLAISRLCPGAAQRLTPSVHHIAPLAAAASALALLILFILSNPLDRFRSRVLRCLMICQAPLPLLIFYLVPPPLVDLSHKFSNPYPKLLVATLAVIGLGSGWLMYRRFRSATIEPQRPLMRAVSPLSVAMLSIFVLGSTAGLPTISVDFFHSGEVLVPWQQIWDFHSIPYVDFAPVHGFMETLRGALDQLFFDGSVANYSSAYCLVIGLAAAATALALAELISPVGALFVLLTILPWLDRLYFVAPPLLLIASPRLLPRPARWLAVWLVVGALATGYNPAMGPAFVLGTLPVALWQTIRGIRQEARKITGIAAVIAILAAITLLVPLLHQVVFGFIRFILDNQWTNECANGIALSQGNWKRDFTWGVGVSQFLWELFRFAWVAVVIAAALVYWRQWSLPRAMRNLPVMVLCASIPPVLLCSSLWVIERLDPGTLGKPGVLSEVSLFLVVPALLMLALPRKAMGPGLLALAVFIGLLVPTPLPTRLDQGPLANSAVATRIVPAGTEIVDGIAAGLPRIGQVIKPNPDFTPKIFKMRDDLSRWLKPGEMFLDLSDADALYYYLGMRCPVQYAAYVAGNSRLQGVMMRQLQQHPVPVVLIGPAYWFDTSPMSFRCYRLYHDYALKFSVVTEDDYLFLVDPARVPEAGPVGSEHQLELLDSAYRRENILRLPSAWGDSWPAMSDRFSEVATINSTQTSTNKSGRVAPLTWPIPAAASSGKNADFVLIHMDFTSADPRAYRQALRQGPTDHSAEPQIALTWTNADGTPSAPILLKGRAGTLLVPLGTYPRWLLGSGMKTITLALQNPGCAKQLWVSKLEFLQLKPL